MALKDDILGEVKAAMKAGEKERLSTLRMLLSAVKNKEIDLRRDIEDTEVEQVARTLVKQRMDSIEQFVKGGREDLAEKERGELDILKAFMPEELGADVIEKVVDETAAEVGAESMKDMGALMKAVMAKLQGKCDGKVVSELVKKKLS